MGYEVNIRRLDLSAMFDLQGPDTQVSRRLRARGLSLPKHPNTRCRSDAGEVYWIGRAHWLLRADIEREDELLNRLQPDTGSPDISLVLVSDVYAFFQVSGPDARQILAVASPLDTARSVFPDEGATFTEAFGLKALVIRRACGFELGFDRSYADMAADYLERVVAS